MADQMKGAKIDPPRLADIEAAKRALQDVVFQTPLLENQDINERLSGRLLIKAESSQRTGAFKIRGAYNRILQMSSDERERGAITYSSGNHAQGVALAARLLGSSALIVMPSDTPAQKIVATRALGADVVTFDRDTEKSDEVVSRLQAETGRIVVPPSGDARVHAGAGTVPLEMIEQAQSLGALLDAVIVPCGGGGLTAMTAFVFSKCSPKTEVYAVEPELFDDTRRSLIEGVRVTNPIGQRTICDAIMTPTPNPHTFEINRKLLAGGLAVTDDEVRDAVLFAYENYKIIVEPGAAVGIAAVLSGKIDIRGKTIATIVTGGNISSERFCELVKDVKLRQGKIK